MVFELVITRNCNLNCKYCFEGDKTDVFMPITLIPQILDFINIYREQNVELIKMKQFDLTLMVVKHFLIKNL